MSPLLDNKLATDRVIKSVEIVPYDISNLFPVPI